MLGTTITHFQENHLSCILIQIFILGCMGFMRQGWHEYLVIFRYLVNALWAAPIPSSSPLHAPSQAQDPARPSHHNLLQSPELLVSASSGWWPSVVCLEGDRSTHGAAASAAAGREVARSCRRGRAVVEWTAPCSQNIQWDVWWTSYGASPQWQEPNCFTRSCVAPLLPGVKPKTLKTVKKRKNFTVPEARSIL